MITALHKFITNPNSFPFILAHNLDKKINGYSRPHYYHIVQNAVTEAKALGLSRISILEFGVAGGNGLVELEQIAKKFQNQPVQFELIFLDIKSKILVREKYFSFFNEKNLLLVKSRFFHFDLFIY